MGLCQRNGIVQTLHTGISNTVNPAMCCGESQRQPAGLALRRPAAATADAPLGETRKCPRRRSSSNVCQGLSRPLYNGNGRRLRPFEVLPLVDGLRLVERVRAPPSEAHTQHSEPAREEECKDLRDADAHDVRCELRALLLRIQERVRCGRREVPNVSMQKTGAVAAQGSHGETWERRDTYCRSPGSRA